MTGIIVVTVTLLLLVSVLYHFNKRKYLIELKNKEFYLDLKNIYLRYLICKEKKYFLEYPEIEKKLMSTLWIIEKTDDFNLKYIKLSRPKVREVFSSKNLKAFKDYNEEIESVKYQELKELDDELYTVIDSIVKFKYPIRSRLFKFVFRLKVRILLNIARVIPDGWINQTSRNEIKNNKFPMDCYNLHTR